MEFAVLIPVSAILGIAGLGLGALWYTDATDRHNRLVKRREQEHVHRLEVMREERRLLEAADRVIEGDDR